MKQLRNFCLVVAIAWFIKLPSHATEPPSARASFVLDASGKAIRLIVTDLDEPSLAAHAKSLTGDAIQLKVVSSPDVAANDQPAVLGKWRVEGKSLVFEPRFPFSSDTAFRLNFARNAMTLEVRTPKKSITPVAKVERIFPTSDSLPENQLRFYIHFSEAMSVGEAYANIKLLDAKGKALENVFLELDEELWDPERKRLTLVLDPGRIKRGLKLREDLGPALENGKSYTLAINGRWRDGEGRALVDKEYRKEFGVGPACEHAIDPQQWKLLAPAPATKEPFEVRFPGPLDRALLQRVVWVENKQGQKLAGTITLGDNERIWRFTPADEWQPGSYRLKAQTTLEDLAGNRIGQAFEVDLFRPITEKIVAKIVELEFVVGRRTK